LSDQYLHLIPPVLLGMKSTHDDSLLSQQWHRSIIITAKVIV